MSSKVMKNTFMLMLLSIAKFILPLVTLPYLTRVLTLDCYGTVAYVKSVMSYFQIIVDFGFVLSGTKKIVKYLDNQEQLNKTVGNVLMAKLLIAVIAFIFLFPIAIFIPLLRENFVYTILSYVPVFLSIFLLDYVFMGLEKMELITIRFVVMKVISTALVFIFVKNDSDILLMPIMDIISSIIAIVLVYVQLSKNNIKIKFEKFKNVLAEIKDSSIYFVSNLASTSFNVLYTVIIGLYFSPSDIAFWTVSLQVISLVQTFYNPISDSIYPEMLRTKNMKLIKKSFKIYIPIIIFISICAYFLSDFGMTIIGGETYTAATPIFRLLIPVWPISFVSILMGWPTLGAIGKSKETSLTTVISIIFQIIMIALLIWADKFNLITIAILRVITEIVLALTRTLFYLRFKKEFNR